MNALELRRRAIMAARKTSRLPPGFQEVAWLESTGTQQIDTNIIADSELGVQIKFAMTDISSISQMGAIGITGGWRYVRHHLQISPQISSNFYYGYNIVNETSKLNTQLDYATHIVSVIPGITTTKLDMDGSDTIIVSKSTFSTNIPYWLFARNASGMSITYFKGRIYFAKLQKSAQLLGDFVPCYRKSDSKPGMYDLVTNTFFVNQGTGEFTLGPEV